jgi:hypothetical protein
VRAASRFPQGHVCSELQKDRGIGRSSDPTAVSDKIRIVDHSLNDGFAVVTRPRRLSSDKLCPFFITIDDLPANIAPKGVVIFWPDNGENENLRQ